MQESQVIKLKRNVYESGLLSFLKSLGAGNGAHKEIVIDFERVNYWIPAAIVGLLTKICHWKSEGKKIKFTNIFDNDTIQYFQRVNFFKYCDYELEENFKRRNPGKRFVPIEGIGRMRDSFTSDAEAVAYKVADCLAPEQAKYIEECDMEYYDEEKTALYDYIQYSVSEMARNVLNHSKSQGFIASQYAQRTDLVRLAIADFGIGIKDSFTNTSYWDDEMDDIGAIKKALEPEVSSKIENQYSGYSTNAGLGLTLMKMLSEKFGGTFTVVSNTGFVNLYNQYNISIDKEFNGTLCAMSFKRNRTTKFPEIFESIKIELGVDDQDQNKPQFL